MADIAFERVSKRFSDQQVIPELDLAVRDGEFLVLLGPSGCGKSTLLRLLAGLEVPSGGEIRIGGRPVTCLGPRERNVAMVFQNYALYPHMTVHGNLEFPLRMRGMGRRERRQRVMETARALGLEAMLDKRPAELSGGQRQRVAMGRALVREPAAFLMDEPLSNLDARLRVQIRAEISGLQRRLGVTTLYVTHDQVEAMTLGDRVAVMRAGTIQQLGGPADLYDDPANLFVAGFLGSPPMNLFTAVTETRGGVRTLRLGGAWLDPPGGVPEPAHYAGLRPEAFSVPGPGVDGVPVRGEVAAVEVLGHERIVYLQMAERMLAGEAGSGLMAARLGVGAVPERGESVILNVLPDRLYWFDADGNRIEPQPAA